MTEASPVACQSHCPLQVLLALACCVLVLAGCGRITTEPPGGASGEGVSGANDPAADGKIRIGLVTDQGGLNDRSFNALANEGMEQAAEEFDIETSVLESASASDYEKNLSAFARGGFDLVIGVGFLMSDPVRSAAANFPATNFMIIDFSYAPDHIPNVRGVLFKEEEAGYLAGTLAGLVQRDTALPGMNKQMVVSSIGGQAIPPVNKYIAGYQAGVKAVCEACTTLNAYSQDFIQQDRCKEQALSHIGQGADIVFQVAGGCGLGALNAAGERGVWGIGVDADQSYLDDERETPFMLTSAMKNVDTAVYETIRDLVGGEYRGGADSIFGLAEDGVGLGEVAEPAQRYMPDVDKVADRILAGEIDIPTDVGGGGASEVAA